MAVRQTRIFVPPTPLFNHSFWVETLLGSVVVPLVQNAQSLSWFWFARYVSDQSDSGDCEINAIPCHFGTDRDYISIGPDGRYRSLRFRYSIEENELRNFECQAEELIKKYNCAVSDFRDYDYVNELGGNRFLAGGCTPPRQVERADLVLQNFNALSKLYLHTLSGPDQNGIFRPELSDSDQNPRHSIFESVHHFFCNISEVPTRVLVSGHSIGTDWYPPDTVDGTIVTSFDVHF
ncbi:MAG: hypothetical protein P4L50_04340 [Anaerolineaceae bacterium]|nr:hypothetical protein [Anaerolineaceae bacterium]